MQSNPIQSNLLYAGTPLPSSRNDPENPVGDGVSMSYESAQKRLLSGRNLMNSLPSSLLTDLVQFGIIHFSQEKEKENEIGNGNENEKEMEKENEKGKEHEDKGNKEGEEAIIISKLNPRNQEGICTGKVKNKDNCNEEIFALKGYKFDKKILKSIKQSFHLYEYLKLEIEKADKFNKSLIAALESFKNSKESKEKNIFYIKEFYKSMWKLIILPPSLHRKILDKILAGDSVVESYKYVIDEEDNNQEKDNNDCDDDIDLINVKKDNKNNINKKSSNISSSSSSTSSSSISKQSITNTINSIKTDKNDRDKDKDKDRNEKDKDRKRPLGVDSLQHLSSNIKSDKISTDNTNINSNLNNAILHTKNKEKSYKKGKYSIPKCASKSCKNEILNNECSYCSDFCASASAGELLTAMLEIRKHLCRQVYGKKDNLDDVRAIVTVSTESKENEKDDYGSKNLTIECDENEENGNERMKKKNKNNLFSVADVIAFESRLLDKDEALNELNEKIKRYGLIYDNDIKKDDLKINEDVDIIHIKKTENFENIIDMSVDTGNVTEISQEMNHNQIPGQVQDPVENHTVEKVQESNKNEVFIVGKVDKEEESRHNEEEKEVEVKKEKNIVTQDLNKENEESNKNNVMKKDIIDSKNDYKNSLNKLLSYHSYDDKYFIRKRDLSALQNLCLSLPNAATLLLLRENEQTSNSETSPRFNVLQVRFLND